MIKQGNAEEFLGSFNRIEKKLNKSYGNNSKKGFTSLIKEIDRENKNRIISSNLRLLESFAELRNAIVHNSEKDYIIAEPHTKMVDKIKEIEKLITNPPKVIPKFQKDVLLFDSSDSIFDSIYIMSENNFSQVPIVDDNRFIGLLNSNTITRWFGKTTNKEIDENGSTIIIKTQIKNVLDYEETDKNYEYINRNTYLHEVVNIFENNKQIDAILITQNGKKDEKLLGIITIWDLIEINKILES